MSPPQPAGNQIGPAVIPAKRKARRGQISPIEPARPPDRQGRAASIARFEPDAGGLQVLGQEAFGDLPPDHRSELVTVPGTGGDH